MAVLVTSVWAQPSPRIDNRENVDSKSVTQSKEYVYVANQGSATVSVIDVAKNDVVETVDLERLGFSANAKPHHIVVEPDGSFWYLSMIVENKVLKFNKRNEIVGVAEFQVPGLMALDITSDHLFVGRSMAAVNPPKRIGLITRSTMKIEELEVFHPRPHAIAVDPTGTFVFSASLSQNRVIAVNLGSGDSSIRNLPGPVHTLVQFAASPDGKFLVIGGQLTGRLLVFDATKPETLPLLKTLQVGAQPWHPVFSPDSQTVYVPGKKANTISVIDMKEMEIARVIEGRGLSQPHGSAIGGGGRYLYVSSNNTDGGYRSADDTKRTPGTVTVVDLKTNAIVKVIEVGGHAAGVGARAYRLNGE